MIAVIQRKTGKLLGHFQPHGKNLYGRHYIIAYKCKHSGFTTAKFRFDFILNRNPFYFGRYYDIRVIAYGYRDANLLPGFVRGE